MVASSFTSLALDLPCSTARGGVGRASHRQKTRSRGTSDRPGKGRESEGEAMCRHVREGSAGAVPKPSAGVPARARKHRRGLEKLGIGGIQSGSSTDVWSPRSHARRESIQWSHILNAPMIPFFKIQTSKCVKTLEKIYLCSLDLCLPSLNFLEPNSKCTWRNKKDKLIYE
jgi:hypothetical protein